MGITVSFFSSAQELSGFLQQQLAETKSLSLSLSKTISQARKEFDSSGTDSKSKAGTRQTEMEGFRVLENPAASYELNLLDEAIKSAQDKIEVLERAGRLIPKLKDSAKIAAIFDDGVPTAFMYYTTKR